jgi:alkanesulfonate monooxygenase SsuD/methylene tetrahydromethanopterin reductase-like flavin-dependent oxidoreductase (luciferase family)
MRSGGPDMTERAVDARPFRFGVNLLTVASRKEWQTRCRQAENLGYDVIAVPDHLGLPAPFPALVSAAEATERPRLAVFVLNAGFYNPTLLARDLAGTDQMVDGRLVLQGYRSACLT